MLPNLVSSNFDLTIKGTFIQKVIDDLDFSDDALFRVSLLLQQYDDVKEDLDPH